MIKWYLVKKCSNCEHYRNNYDLEQKKVKCTIWGKPSHTTVFKSYDHHECELHQKTINKNDCCDDFKPNEDYSDDEYLLLTPDEVEQLKKFKDIVESLDNIEEQDLLYEMYNDNEKLKKENMELKQLIDLFAGDICTLTELLCKNNIDYKLHSDVENFIIKWGIRIE